MNFRNIYTRLIIMILAVSAGSFTACSSDDDKNSGTVLLEAFGPSPALRGGELRFLGNNMNKVSEVILPDNITVTDIIKVSDKEIKITIPQNTKSGYVVLKTPSGEITSKTMLTFSEPIIINKFYKTGSENITSVKAGDEITIEGDYMNLIREVIFSDDVSVSLNREDGGEYSREKLTVIVPLGARTGKIAVSNGAEIPIVVYSEDDLSVATASVSSLTPTTIKAGTELLIKGSNLQLTEKVAINPKLEIEVPQAEDPYADLTEIKITIPDNAQDGEVKLIGYSGLEIVAGNIILKLPVIASIAPTPVKGGETLTVKGTDLDLVTDITFPNVEEAVKYKTKTETEITVVVPIAAGDGNIAFNTASGKNAEKEFKTVKSTITEISPVNLTAGEKITIKGTNLDLVRSVTFGGDVTAEITPENSTLFVVTVPTTATSGKVTLNLVSGASVLSEVSLNVTPPTNPVITSMPTGAKPDEEITLKGSNLNTVESIYFGTVKVTAYGERTSTSITLTVPASVGSGSYKIKMVNYSGEEFYSNDQIEISGVDPVQDASYVFFDFDGKGSWWGNYGSVENDPDLSLSGAYFRINQDLPSGWVDFFWRNGQDNFKTDNVTVDGWVIKMDVNVLNENDKTPEFKFRLNGSIGDYWSIIPALSNKGGWYTVTIPLTGFFDGDGYGENSLPNVQGINQDFGLAANGAGFTNICIDNIRFEKK